MFELSAGQIVADKYRVDGIMGSGGMGVVVAATHIELDQRVAIKFLREVSPEALARFQREARMLVRLRSPHVARVFDVGALEDDTPYIVMEHLEGEDLASALQTRGRLPVDEAVDYVLQAMEAVAEAHALGMVHRDLKPANLFLAKGPGGTTTVKVLDFGVSKIRDDRGDSGEVTRGGDLTNEGVALGSPGYMSPEQMTSARDVDARADVFSLGAMLYRLISGQTPYRGASIVSILAAMATEPIPPLGSVVAGVPAGFAEIVERCLAQDPVGRWPTVAHLAHALLPFAGRRGRLAVEQITATLGLSLPQDAFADTVVRPVSARIRVSQPEPTIPSSPSVPLPSYPLPVTTGSESRVAIIAAVCLLLAVGAGLGTWRALRTPARGHDGAEEESTTFVPPVPVPVSVTTPPPPSVSPPVTPAVDPPSAGETAQVKPPVAAKPPPARPPRPHGAHTTTTSTTSSPGSPPLLPPDRH